MALTLAAPRADAAPRPFTWQPAQLAPGIVDLAGPRSDGRFVAAVSSGLSLFGGGSLAPFTSTSGPGAYVPSPGEPYIALTPKLRLRKAGCTFHRDEVFAIASQPTRLVRITRRGFASSFAGLPESSISGITFDTVGTFGHRLLVTSVTGVAPTRRTTVYAIDCRGRAQPIVSGAPQVEGGIAVAPRTFGRFAGRLIAADEVSGNVWAFSPGGGWRMVAAPPNLGAGADIGVESVGFVPPHFGRKGAAFLSDRGVPGNPYPGTDSILRVGAGALKRALVRAGDMLVATEGGAETIAIRCRRGKRSCGVRFVGTGPDVAHSEGHIVFRRAG